MVLVGDHVRYRRKIGSDTHSHQLGQQGNLIHLGDMVLGSAETDNGINFEKGK